MGGNALPDKLTLRQQPTSVLSRFLPSISLPSDSTFAGLQDTSSSNNQSSINSLTSFRLKSNLRSKVAFNNQSSSAISGSLSVYSLSSLSISAGSKALASSANIEIPGSVLSMLPRKYSTYAERISTASTFSDGIGTAVGSPKSKKTGLETREDLLSSLQQRQDSSATMGTASIPAFNVIIRHQHLPTRP